jgi:hypothetical protein
MVWNLIYFEHNSKSKIGTEYYQCFENNYSWVSEGIR